MTVHPEECHSDPCHPPTGHPRLQEDEMIGELSGMVTLFKDKALAMGLSVKQDVKEPPPPLPHSH